LRRGGVGEKKKCCTTLLKSWKKGKCIWSVLDLGWKTGKPNLGMWGMEEKRRDGGNFRGAKKVGGDGKVKWLGKNVLGEGEKDGEIWKKKGGERVRREKKKLLRERGESEDHVQKREAK